MVDTTSATSTKQDDIMEALLAHERKGAETKLVIPGVNNHEDSSSGSEDSVKPLQPFMEPGKIYFLLISCV